MKKLAWPKLVPVASVDHSVCGSARIEDLDFRNWWTDGSFDSFYLHVKGGTEDLEGTSHRVWPRRNVKNVRRLEMLDGVLFWIVDRPSKSLGHKHMSRPRDFMPAKGKP